jgi:GNAT superfamily N-acetyltransferase
MWVLLVCKNVIGIVAELESPITAIAGFCIDSVHPTHLTIVDLAVHPAHRRQGYGFKIVSKLLQHAEQPQEEGDPCLRAREEPRRPEVPAHGGVQGLWHVAPGLIMGRASRCASDARAATGGSPRVT